MDNYGAAIMLLLVGILLTTCDIDHQLRSVVDEPVTASAPKTFP